MTIRLDANLDGTFTARVVSGRREVDATPDNTFTFPDMGSLIAWLPGVLVADPAEQA